MSHLSWGLWPAPPIVVGERRQADPVCSSTPTKGLVTAHSGDILENSALPSQMPLIISVYWQKRAVLTMLVNLTRARGHRPPKLPTDTATRRKDLTPILGSKSSILVRH